MKVLPIKNKNKKMKHPLLKKKIKGKKANNISSHFPPLEQSQKISLT